MAEPIKMRIRDGCRGGREQFTWNSIKDQEYKDRECYLGGSTKVGMMGKFGRYYQHDWYAKKRDSAETIDEERSTVKAYEEELMQEALGLKPKKLLLAKRQLTEEELKEFFKSEKNPDKKGREAMGPQKKIVKNEFGEEVAQSNEDMVAEAARDAPTKGLGFASHRTAKLEEIKAKTLGTVGQLQGSGSMSSTAPVKQEVLEVKEESAASEAGPDLKKEQLLSVKEEEAAMPPPAAKRRREDEGSQERLARKAEKKDKKARKAEKKLRKLEKKERKLAKKEKKAAKEAKKLAKKARHDASASSSSSSSS